MANTYGINQFFRTFPRAGIGQVINAGGLVFSSSLYTVEDGIYYFLDFRLRRQTQIIRIEFIEEKQL